LILILIIALTQERIESTKDVLKEILKPVFDEKEGITWPLGDFGALKLMDKVSTSYILI